MAKNKVQVDVEIDDNGSLKGVAKDAGKAAKGLDGVGAAAGTADRNLKGAAQASSNSTKNFSKMAQGMSGGLVPAYAAVAAQVFALTAAFDFLKNAADVQNLKAGQTQFANSTGIALKSVTSKLQEASQGMLSFKEAAQSAAIGAAKGFSTSQLERMAIGAGKAATALGRDYTDTYDRLIRGVSKAEPELLDELGITLKLEEAKRKYAKTLGVSADQLTAAQSSQAVYVETMAQLNNQFGQMENRPNPFIQLQKTFSGIATEVMSNIMPAFNAVADFLNNNAKAATAAFAAIVGMVLLNISGLSEGIGNIGRKITGVFSSSASVVAKFGGKLFEAGTTSANNFIKKMDEVEKSIKDAYTKQKEITTGKAQGLIDKGSSSKSVQKLAQGKSLAPAAMGKLKKDIDTAIEKMGDLDTVAGGVFKGLTKKELRGFRKELEKTGRQGLTAGQKIKKGLAKTAVVALKSVRLAAKGTVLAIKGIGKAAMFAGKALKFMGKATVILAVMQQLYDMFMKIAEAPATIVKNVIGALTNIAKGIQFVLNNVIVRAINGLLDGMPDWLKPDALKGKRMEQFTFANDAEEKLTNFTNKQLKNFGFENGINDLTAIEEKNIALNEEKAKKEGLVADFRSLASEMATIGEGLAKQKGVRKTQSLANAFSTLPILGALNEANKNKLIPEFTAAMNAANINLDAFGPKFKKAFQERDIEALQGFATAGQTYNASMSTVKDTLANLSDLMSSDPVKARLVTGPLLENAKAADSAATAMEGVESGVKLVDQTFEASGGLDAYNKALDTLIANMEEVKQRQQTLALSKIHSAIMPGIFKAQAGRQQAVDASEIELARLQNAIMDKQRQLPQADATTRVDLEKEIANLERLTQLENAKLDNAKRNLSDVGRIGLAVGESLSSSMTQAFQGLVDGSMKAKDAFKHMATSILQSISKIITELLVMKILQSSLGGTSLGTFLGIPGGSSVPVSESYLPMQFNGGGVASGPRKGYPAILHGTEAVVPLPDGKAIPVQMQNGTGQQNNISVNVNVDNNGQSNTDVSGDQGGMDLGKAIAQAVQEELQNQKRSGGILNPYGAA